MGRNALRHIFAKTTHLHYSESIRNIRNEVYGRDDGPLWGRSSRDDGRGGTLRKAVMTGPGSMGSIGRGLCSSLLFKASLRLS